jgi:aminopeptidase N
LPAFINSQFEAVVPQDFFDAIGNVTSPTAASLFASWTIKSGFPLVTASRNGTRLTLTQKRFMRSGIDNNKTERYNIPISIATSSTGFDNAITFPLTFPEDASSVVYTFNTAPTSYYMLNVQQTGFYRVNYDEDNWNKIRDALHSEDMAKIHVLNRAQVVDDLFNLARGGVVEYKQAIDIIRYLKNETHYIPWLAAINHGLTFLSQRVKSEDARIFEWFVNDLMAKIYEKLTFDALESDRRTDIYNRVNVLTWLCKYGHAECISNAKEAFGEYLSAYKRAPRDHRQLIYCNAIRYGGDEEFNFLFERFLREDIAFEQLNILNALGCSRNETNIKVCAMRYC